MKISLLSIAIILLTLVGFQNCSQFDVQGEGLVGSVNTNAAPVLSLQSLQSNKYLKSGEIGVIFSAIDEDPDTLIFMCKHDDDAEVLCLSPYRFHSETEGPHSLTIRAIDALNKSAELSFQWNIDNTPPVVTMNTVLAERMGSGKLSFAFDVSDNSQMELSVMCSINGAAATECEPVNGSYILEHPNSEAGANSASVFATDLAGNTSEVKQISWVMDESTPSLAVTRSSALNPTSSKDDTFSISASDDDTEGLSLTCKVNSEDAEPCAAGTYNPANESIIEGENTLLVEVKDASGNASSLELKWEVDTTAPSVEIVDNLTPVLDGKVNAATPVDISLNITEPNLSELKCELLRDGNVVMVFNNNGDPEVYPSQNSNGELSGPMPIRDEKFEMSPQLVEPSNGAINCDVSGFKLYKLGHNSNYVLNIYAKDKAGNSQLESLSFETADFKKLSLVTLNSIYKSISYNINSHTNIVSEVPLKFVKNAAVVVTSGGNVVGFPSVGEARTHVLSNLSSQNACLIDTSVFTEGNYCSVSGSIKDDVVGASVPLPPGAANSFDYANVVLTARSGGTLADHKIECFKPNHQDAVSMSEIEEILGPIGNFNYHDYQEPQTDDRLAYIIDQQGGLGENSSINGGYSMICPSLYPPATQLAVKGLKSNTTLSTGLEAFTVEIHSQSGMVISSGPDSTTEVTLYDPVPEVGGGTLVDGTESVNAVDGVASFRRLKFSRAGTFDLQLKMTPAIDPQFGSRPPIIVPIRVIVVKD